MSRVRCAARGLLAAALVASSIFVAHRLGYGGHPRIEDRAGVLDRRRLYEFEYTLRAIRDESGIDIRFVFLDRVPGGSLEEFAVREARALGMGQRMDRRGVLFAYDVSRRRFRIEVGPTSRESSPIASSAS